MKYKKSDNHKRYNYKSLKDYEVEEGTTNNLKIGTECIIDMEELDFKKHYHIYKIRPRLIKGSFVQGVKITKGETEEEYMSNYVSYIKWLIKNKKIYKVTRK
jgi:hypothetical protein